jgi:hypothetical protein
MRLGWKWSAVINGLAYTTAVKGFIEQAPVHTSALC